MRQKKGIAVAALAAGLIYLPLGSGSEAAAVCQTTSPASNAYSVTVCLTTPGPTSVLTGVSPVSATVTRSAGAPVVTKVTFTLNGAYVLTDYEAPYDFELPTQQWVDGTRTLQVSARLSDAYTTPLLGQSVLFSNGVLTPPVVEASFAPFVGAEVPATEPFVVAAVGDGADGRGRSRDVTAMMDSWDPDMMLYLGDVYEKGSAAEFHNHYGSGDKVFGRFKDITNPTIGNHEYSLDRAKAYFDYWHQVPHYYSYEAHGWKFISLDSTSEFGQTSPGTAQFEWLKNELEENTSPCTIAYFHHPPYSVGKYGTDARMSAIWSLLAQHGVDLAFAGHEHNYQRWVPLNGAGTPDAAGTTLMIVGTGGRSSYGFVKTDPRMAYGVATSPQVYGALKLSLGAYGAAYEFVNTSGSSLDGGSITCSGAPADAESPSIPTNLVATASTGNRVDLSWAPSVDDFGVDGYEVLRNGQLLTTIGPADRWTDNGVVPGATYEYQVRAFDAVGNFSDLSAAATVSTPSVLFGDDFETGNLSRWTKAVGMVAQQTDVFSGAYAGRALASGGAAYATKNLPQAQSDVYSRIRFKVTSRGSKNVYLVKHRAINGVFAGGIFINPTGNLVFRNGVTAKTILGQIPVSSGQWHELQLRTGVGAGQLQVWFDGSPVTPLNRSENLGSSAISAVAIGDSASGNNFNVAFDDVAVGVARIN